MKFLWLIIVLVNWLAIGAAAQISEKDGAAKKEFVVPVVRQLGSRKFGCAIMSKSGVFNSEWELRSIKGGDNCLNPIKLLGIDFAKHTLISYQVAGDCFVRAKAGVFRRDEAKTYHVRITERYGGCRAGGRFQGWVVVDKIPDHYKVVFSERRLKSGEELEIDLIEDVLSLTKTELEFRKYEMKNCVRMFGEGKQFVIKTEAEFRAAVRSDVCLEKLEKINYEKETLLGLSLYTGSCDVPDGLKYRVARDDAKKRFVVFISYYEGGICRAYATYNAWLVVPKLPDDYTVKFEVASIIDARRNY